MWYLFRKQKKALMKTLRRFVVLALVLLGLSFTAQAQTRSVELETTEVTRPDVAVAPNGEWMVFTALGHLFRLPVEGGTAEQLTFGPWFDSDPAISPDGQQVVFASDRDGRSNGNLFRLDLVSGGIQQLTQEWWAARPVWSPDGRSIGYLSYEPRGLWAEYEFVDANGVLAQVRRVSAQGGTPETLTDTPGLIRSAFHLPDGRLAWTTLEAGAADGHPKSRIDVVTSQGAVSTLTTVEGVLDRVVADATGDGLYVRRYEIPASGFLVPQPEEIAFVSLNGQEVRTITQLISPQPRPGFSVSEGTVYLGEQGTLWQIDAATGEREAISFSASIKMDVFSSSKPPHYTPEQGREPSSILDPRLAPDGESLIFTAAGFLWRQFLNGGSSRRLFEGEGFHWGAAALSPDGRRLAYQHSEGNLQELRVGDLESGQTKTLVTVDRTGRFEPAWSPDGNQIVYVGFTSSKPSLYVVDVETGQRKKLVDSFPRYMPRPQFSADGAYVYYTSVNQVFRYALQGEGKPEPITQFKGGHVADGMVSPDGKWLTFRRNEEIWVAPMSGLPVTDATATRLTDDGGFNVSFAPDSPALIYATGSTVWRHPLDGGERVEIPIHLELPVSAPAPMLIRNVRVLDFEAGGFTEATSMLIDQGRIQWIGAEAGRTLSEYVKVLEAEGRYAIPGLFDMHTHVATPIHFNPARDVSHMASNLAFGVTSVRDMGSDITLVKAWTDRRVNYGKPVPRIFSGGAMTEVTEPFFHGGSFFVKTEEEARAIVRKEKRDGAMAIKSYFTLPWPLHRAIADEARRQNMPVAAHGLIFREMVMGPVLGRATIEHQPSPIRVYADILKLLAETGTQWDPTFAALGGNGILFAQQPHLLSEAKLRAFTSEGDYALAEEVELFSILDPVIIGRVYASQLASMRQAHALGVSLLAGTDALNPNVFYGHGLHMELWHLARAGIPPLDVLRLATQEAATTVGAGDVLGTLEPGKLADVVLLNANPLLDIRHAMDMWRVIQGGRVFASEPKVTDR